VTLEEKETSVERARYEDFARRHYDDVLKKAALFVGWQAAPDLAQEIFLKLWRTRALERYEDRGQVQSWLLSIVVRTAIDRNRKKRVEVEASDPHALGHELASEDATQEEALERIAVREELLAVLYSEIEGSKHAAAFVEYYAGDRPLKEIAEESGASYVSMRQGVARLATRVKEAFAKRGLLRASRPKR